MVQRIESAAVGKDKARNGLGPGGQAARTHGMKPAFARCELKVHYTQMRDLRQRLPEKAEKPLHQELAAAKAPHDQTVLQGQIDATDRHIDRLVYELYGLTDEEIAIVEEATAR